MSEQKKSEQKKKPHKVPKTAEQLTTSEAIRIAMAEFSNGLEYLKDR
jgi:hypothetical protein